MILDKLMIKRLQNTLILVTLAKVSKVSTLNPLKMKSLWMFTKIYCIFRVIPIQNRRWCLQKTFTALLYWEFQTPAFQIIHLTHLLTRWVHWISFWLFLSPSLHFLLMSSHGPQHERCRGDVIIPTLLSMSSVLHHGGGKEEALTSYS